VREGEHRIAEQQMRIVDLRERGADATSSALLLDELNRTQPVFVRHLEYEERQAGLDDSTS